MSLLHARRESSSFLPTQHASNRSGRGQYASVSSFVDVAAIGVEHPAQVFLARLGLLEQVIFCVGLPVFTLLTLAGGTWRFCPVSGTNVQLRSDFDLGWPITVSDPRRSFDAQRAMHTVSRTSLPTDTLDSCRRVQSRLSLHPSRRCHGFCDGHVVFVFRGYRASSPDGILQDACAVSIFDFDTEEAHGGGVAAGVCHL